MCYFTEEIPGLDNSPPHMVELIPRPPNVLQLVSRLTDQAAEHWSGQLEQSEWETVLGTKVRAFMQPITVAIYHLLTRVCHVLHLRAGLVS